MATEGKRDLLVQVRLDAETRTRWTAAAKDVGQSLSAFIRDTVDASLDASTGGLIHSPLNPEFVGAKMTVASPKKAATSSRATCPRERFHRPGVFCKTCGKSW